MGDSFPIYCEGGRGMRGRPRGTGPGIPKERFSGKHSSFEKGSVPHFDNELSKCGTVPCYGSEAEPSAFLQAPGRTSIVEKRLRLGYP